MIGGRRRFPLDVPSRGAEEAVEFLARHVLPVPEVDAKRVERLIQTLNSDEFTEREASTKELKELASQFKTTLTPLRKALKDPASPEVKTRLESILADALQRLDRTQPAQGLDR